MATPPVTPPVFTDSNLPQGARPLTQQEAEALQQGFRQALKPILPQLQSTFRQLRENGVTVAQCSEALHLTGELQDRIMEGDCQ